jgi:hypothetical protein
MLLDLSSDREGLSLALLDAMGAGVYGMAGDPRMENWSGLTFERGSAAYLGGMTRFRLANPVIRQAAGARRTGGFANTIFGPRWYGYCEGLF